MSADTAGPLKRTPLYDLHCELGAKMVPFAGYEMPVQYQLGILKEHQHTRARAGLFDVSHMGQAYLIGPDHQTTAAALEALVPADILNLKPGMQRYTQLLNSEGGIVDDLMVTRPADPAEDGKLLLVVNASRKEVDYEYISGRLPASVRLEPQPDRALLALQGPEAAAVLAKHCADAVALGFMAARPASVGPFACHISRSGYTGEDGFEISVAADQVVDFARLLLADEAVQPAGLGARDSLRLEAGLCLYGHELDEMTTPVEAGLVWSIQKRRREEGGFPGAERIQRELREGPKRLRVGIKPEGRAPARDGTEILDTSGARIGVITSGGFGPTVNGPIAMGYVETSFAKPGTPVQLMVRGKALPAQIVDLPFVPHRYFRKT
ncbi:MAG: glycine cleavage system aminomethyltransferase GcvT [Proteobacteria bacterium]|jgi:glycine cleavage system T protein|nr:MAG: glycine cleavage system aminomethyltransferase GcvT [Pseudomonadota bacterium]